MIVRIDLNEGRIADLHDAGLLSVDEFDTNQAISEALLAAVMIVGRMGRKTMGEEHAK